MTREWLHTRPTHLPYWRLWCVVRGHGPIEVEPCLAPEDSPGSILWFAHDGEMLPPIPTEYAEHWCSAREKALGKLTEEDRAVLGV